MLLPNGLDGKSNKNLGQCNPETGKCYCQMGWTVSQIRTLDSVTLKLGSAIAIWELPETVSQIRTLDIVTQLKSANA